MVTEDTLAQLDGCDFIDFGCKTGGSFDLCERILGGTRGLGVDRNPGHVEKFRAAGGRAVVGDVTSLALPDDCVRFVCISHVLEHLRSWDDVRLAVREAVRVARDFVVIVGPYFDDDERLRGLGVKYYWSDWVWHPTHVDAQGLAQLMIEEGIGDFTCWGKIPISHTLDRHLLPLDAPRNQQHYDAAIHPPKPSAAIAPISFKEMVIVITLQPMTDLETLLGRMKVHSVLGPYTQSDALLQKHSRLHRAP